MGPSRQIEADLATGGNFADGAAIYLNDVGPQSVSIAASAASDHQFSCVGHIWRVA